MLLQFKVYLISIIYFLGILFMILFPPRNFRQSGAKIRKIRSTPNVLKYPTYVDPKALLSIASQFSNDESEVVRTVLLTPNTYENRSIVAIELRSDKQSKKPGVLVIGALNGMAWGALNAILELADKLLFDANYQTPFFNDYDWYLIPTANPDGIQFTQDIRSRQPLEISQWSRNLTARSNTRPVEWHKNVDKDLEKDTCFGTNINRNFAYHWQDDVHKKPDLCSQSYPGSRPFSTAESQAIRTYLDGLGESIQLAIHLHASFVPKKVVVIVPNRSGKVEFVGIISRKYEYILYPWRYSLRQPSNYRALQEIGEYAARQARLPDGRLYQVHQGSNDARVAGTLSDYMSGVVGIDLVFIIKPYHEPFPNYTDASLLETYVRKSITTILSVVRGWRSSTKQNTLSFFGKDVEF